jgi:hypothetical protein
MLALKEALDRTTELAVIRRAYAKQVLAEVQVDDPQIEASFAAVPREAPAGVLILAQLVGMFDAVSLSRWLWKVDA